MWSLLIAIFYQPFLNALVLIYWALGYMMEHPDMGVAVIVFTFFVRLLLFPLTIAATQSEDERRKIGRKFADIQEKYKSSEPLKFRQLRGELVREHQSSVRFEAVNLLIQVTIAVILWRVFGQGLVGADLHLIYSWMPVVEMPFQLTAFGIDLTHPSLLMNLLSSALLFLLETLQLSFSPLPPTSQDRALQFLLPVIVFAYLYNMPAGKKFFVVTTLAISVVMILSREVGGLFALARTAKK